MLLSITNTVDRLPTEIFLEKMTSPEVIERLKESDIAIVVVGAIEGHGPHLPLETDLIEVWEITKRAALKVADEVKPVIAPPIPYGACTYEVRSKTFSGTISLQFETLQAVVKDVCKSLISHGFRKIVVMDSHWDNYAPILIAIQEVTEETGAFLVHVRWPMEFGIDIIQKVTDTHMIYHACETETSVALAIGCKVQLDKVKKAWWPKSPSKYIKFTYPASSPLVEAAFGSIVAWEKVAKFGYVGDPTKASKEKGEEIVSKVVDRLSDFLRELKRIQV